MSIWEDDNGNIINRQFNMNLIYNKNDYKMELLLNDNNNEKENTNGHNIQVSYYNSSNSDKNPIDFTINIDTKHKEDNSKMVKMKTQNSVNIGKLSDDEFQQFILDITQGISKLISF